MNPIVAIIRLSLVNVTACGRLQYRTSICNSTAFEMLNVPFKEFSIIKEQFAVLHRFDKCQKLSPDYTVIYSDLSQALAEVAYLFLIFKAFKLCPPLPC